MAEVLEKLPLDRETKAVLLGQPSALRPVFQLMLAHESGEWQAAAELSEGLHLKSEDVAAYLLAGATMGAGTLARAINMGLHCRPSAMTDGGRLNAGTRSAWPPVQNPARSGPCGLAQWRVT